MAKEIQGIKSSVDIDTSSMDKAARKAAEFEKDIITGRKKTNQVVKKFAREFTKEDTKELKKRIKNLDEELKSRQTKIKSFFRKQQIDQKKQFALLEQARKVHNQKVARLVAGQTKAATPRARPAAGAGIAAGLFGGIGLVGIKSQISEFVTASNKAESAAKGLAAVVRSSLGTSALGDAQKAVQELSSSGLLDPASASQAVKNLVSVGFSIEDTVKLLKANLDIAVDNRQAHLGLSESIVVFTEGVKNGNSVLSDATGISKNLSTILKEQKFRLEDVSSATKGAAARQALLNGLLKETAPFMGRASQAALEFQGTQAKLTNETQKFNAAIGDSIKVALAPILGILAEAIKGFREWFTSLKPLTQQILTTTGVVAALGAAIVPLLAGLKGVIGFLSGGGGLISLIGGPWVVGIVAATVAIVALVAVLNELNETGEERFKNTTKNIKALDKEIGELEKQRMKNRQLLKEKENLFKARKLSKEAIEQERKALNKENDQLNEQINLKRKLRVEALETLRIQEAETAQRIATLQTQLRAVQAGGGRSAGVAPQILMGGRERATGLLSADLKTQQNLISQLRVAQNELLKPTKAIEQSTRQTTVNIGNTNKKLKGTKKALSDIEQDFNNITGLDLASQFRKLNKESDAFLKKTQGTKDSGEQLQRTAVKFSRTMQITTGFMNEINIGAMAVKEAIGKGWVKGLEAAGKVTNSIGQTVGGIGELLQNKAVKAAAAMTSQFGLAVTAGIQLFQTFKSIKAELDGTARRQRQQEEIEKRRIAIAEQLNALQRERRELIDREFEARKKLIEFELGEGLESLKAQRELAEQTRAQTLREAGGLGVTLAFEGGQLVQREKTQEELIKEQADRIADLAAVQTIQALVSDPKAQFGVDLAGMERMKKSIEDAGANLVRPESKSLRDNIIKEINTTIGVLRDIEGFDQPEFVKAQLREGASKALGTRIGEIPQRYINFEDQLDQIGQIVAANERIANIQTSIANEETRLSDLEQQQAQEQQAGQQQTQAQQAQTAEEQRQAQLEQARAQISGITGEARQTQRIEELETLEGQQAEAQGVAESLSAFQRAAALLQGFVVPAGLEDELRGDLEEAQLSVRESLARLSASLEGKDIKVESIVTNNNTTVVNKFDGTFVDSRAFVEQEVSPILERQANSFGKTTLASASRSR